MGYAKDMKVMKRRIIGGIAAGVVLLGGIIGVAVSHESVKPGYLGIVYNMSGGIEKETLKQGWNWIAPWKSVNQYSISTEQGFLSKDSKEGSKTDDSFMIPTSDGKTVNVDIEYAYHFEADKLPDTFTRFKGQDGKTIEDTFIRAKIKSWASEVSSTFSVLEIYGEKRADLNAKTLTLLKKSFNDYGIVIDSVNFSRIGLDTQTETAIQARINAQQALEQEKVERDRASITAEKLKVEAQGKADAALIEAQGQAKANDALQASITPLLIQKMEMEARLAHGWVTTQVNGQAIVDTTKK